MAQDHVYFNDLPIEDIKSDKFNRWPFAKRVAETIANREDQDSLVLGLYGMWGEGKTTVLNFVQKELSVHSNVVCIKFNPWRYNNEEQLLIHFFKMLAEILNESLKTKTEQVGQAMQKYSALLTPVSFLNPLPIKEKWDEIGKTLSGDSNVEVLKERIISFLKKAGKKIVVLMDDIDRLDKSEIHSVFRLVKLSADFPFLNYVLAFDKDMVAVALRERYGGDQKAGYSFLEKIIQVPLQLPPADEFSLRELCFQGVSQALDSAGINISNEEGGDFVYGFDQGLLAKLQTPRMAKRYCNALSFSLPILKGEVDPIDLCLIEGIRVFYPEIYNFIRDNPGYFLGSVLHRHSGQGIKEKVQAEIDQIFVGLTPDEKKGIQDLLGNLFPRFREHYENITFSAGDVAWAKAKKAATSEYFHRYFSYAITQTDIADKSVDELILKLKDDSTTKLSKLLEKSLSGKNSEKFVDKLVRKIDNLSDQEKSILVKVMSRLGNKFPDQKGFLGDISSPRGRATMLVGNLIKSVENKKAKVNIVLDVVTNGKDIEFVSKCMRWIISREDKQAEMFTKQEKKKFAIQLQKRIISEEKGGKSYIFSKGTAGDTTVFAIWRHYFGSHEPLKDYLKKWIKKDYNIVPELLKQYRVTGYSMTTGRPSSAPDLERNGYDNFKFSFGAANEIYAALKKKYGKKMESPEYDIQNVSENEKVCHQFSFIHLKVIEEEKKKQADVNKT